MRTTLLTWVAVLAVLGQAAHEKKKMEQAAIERAQDVLVSKFDSSLPRVSLKFFLESEAEGTKISWEMNDCGEQTGDPSVDRGRDMPTCVEASFTLKDQRTVDVMVAVGTSKKGIAGDVTLFSATLTDETGTHVIKLIELPAKLQRGKPRKGPAERAPVVGNVLA